MSPHVEHGKRKGDRAKSSHDDHSKTNAPRQWRGTTEEADDDQAGEEEDRRPEEMGT